MCVRGGRSPATQLTVLSGPAFVGLNQVPSSATPLYVVVKDASGNRVNAGGVTVTISATTLGALSGTTSVVTDYRGLATFNNFTLNTAGSATLTISATGLTSTSHTLTVKNEFLGNGCTAEDAAFTTTNGGCQDNVTGLSWSSISTNTMTWYQAVWDSLQAGSQSSDADDYGRGNDYSEIVGEDCMPTSTNGGFYSCNNSTNTRNPSSVNTTAYCKSLNEGGKTDWRVPTKLDLLTLYSHGATTHINGTLSQGLWSSSTNTNNYGADYVQLSNNTWGLTEKTTAFRVMCVRGGRANATKLSVISGPSVMGVGATSSTPLVVRVQDASNNYLNASGRTVTIASSDLGTPGGTLTAVTDYRGTATFSAFTLSTAGTATITISTAGLTSATKTISVRAGITSDQHSCKTENARFITQNGGCHDTTAHLVWSAMSSSNYSWHQVVWDSVNLSGNAAADGNDSRTNDYDLTSGYTTSSPYYDTSVINYCHDLTQGGKSDWRPPTFDEVVTAGTAGAAGTYFDASFIAGYSFWTASASGANGYYGNFTAATYGLGQNTKTVTSYRGVCVRTQP